MLSKPDWKSMSFQKSFWILTGIPRKPFKILQTSGIPQDCETAGFGILQKLLLFFLEILKFLGAQFKVTQCDCRIVRSEQVQFAKCQEFWNVCALQIFERKVLLSELSSGTVFESDRLSSGSVAKPAWVFWDWGSDLRRKISSDLWQ